LVGVEGLSWETVLMPGRRNGGRYSTLAAVVGALALVVSVGWVVLVWYRHGATDADPRASVLSFLLAAVLALVGLVGWVRRRRVAAVAPVTAEQVGQAAVTLAEMVAEQWTREATARSLGDPGPMPVRWRLSTTASGIWVQDHPEVIAAAGLTFTSSSARISEVVAAFRGLDRRRLVITGGAGTGKTTLAVQLLLELLAHPKSGEPVPVLFSLVGWNPQEQPRMQDWLTARLERDYPGLRSFGDDTAQALVERGKILPILDGLDEVPATLRPGIITALNDAAFPAGSGLILTSRRAEYAEAVAGAGDVLTAAAVIAPLALTRLEAASYLRKLLPPNPGAAWSTVLDQLETGTAADLAIVTASPLGLWLVRAIYVDGHQDPTPLIVEGGIPRPIHAPTLQAQLLDQLIPAVLHNRPPIPRRRSADSDVPLRPGRQYDPDDVRRWLTTLAVELRAAETRDWLWWYLARRTFPTSTSGGLTAEPAHTYLRVRGRVPELLGTLLGAVLVSVPVCGLLFMLLGGLADWLRGGILSGLVDGLRSGLEVQLEVGLVIGLVIGLVDGLIGFGTSSNIAQRASSPAESLHGDRLTVLLTSAVGLVTALVIGLVSGLLVGGAVGGLLMGGLVAVILVEPGNRAWPAFLVASGWLAARHRLPWRLMAFLEDAYRLGLLRVAGSAYQFRHAELQDHLAPDLPRVAANVA
jgi:hypothetical protein